MITNLEIVTPKITKSQQMEQHIKIQKYAKFFLVIF